MGGSNIIEMDAVGYDPDTSLIAAEAGVYRLHIRGEKPADERIVISVRPEWIRVVDEQAAGKAGTLFGVVLNSTFLGSMVRYRVSGPGGAALTIEVHNPEAKGILGKGDLLWYHIPPDRPIILRA